MWVTLKWFQLPLLLLVSLLLSHFTCAEFLLWGLYILKSTQLLSWSHFCLQELQRLLTCIFLVYYHIMLSSLLLRIVLLVHNFRDLCRLIFVHGHTSVCCLMSLFYPSCMLMCSWTHTLLCLFIYCSFACIGHADMICSTVSSNCLHRLHLLSVSVWFCNAWSCAAIISLSASAFRSPLDSHRDVSALLISYLYF